MPKNSKAIKKHTDKLRDLAKGDYYDPEVKEAMRAIQRSRGLNPSRGIEAGNLGRQKSQARRATN